jgi:hypothetical protein
MRSPRCPRLKSKTLRRLAMVALLGAGLTLVDGNTPVVKAATPKPFLIEHGWDVSTATQIASKAAKINALPFDGLSVRLENEPIGTKPVSFATAQAELNPMPTLTNVKHNFVIFRLLDSTRPLPYDLYDDAIWNTIASNTANVARAAAATGKFDGIIIDPEYYGSSSVYPWDYGASTTPWTFSATDGATPGRHSAEAQAKAQARGKQVTDAMRAFWPNIKVWTFYGAWVSEPASFTATRMKGNNVAWANELLGPWVAGIVQSTVGTPATVIDGGESYRQRTPTDFQNAYNWLKTGFATFPGGKIVPPHGLASTDYNSKIQVCIGVYDGDVANGYRGFSAAKVQELLTYGLRNADQYEWFYSEQFDWRGNGWPTRPVTQQYINAVRNAKQNA